MKRPQVDRWDRMFPLALILSILSIVALLVLGIALGEV